MNLMSAKWCDSQRNSQKTRTDRHVSLMTGGGWVDAAIYRRSLLGEVDLQKNPISFLFYRELFTL